MVNLVKEIREIIRYRQLLWKLSINQIKAKYRYPVLGILWSVLTPLLMSIIFLIAFGMIMKVRIAEYPFLVYFLSGMFPWIYFSSSVIESTSSLVQHSSLIKSVAFCRQIIPLSSILINLINLFFSLPVLFLFLLIFKVKISIYIFFLPIILLLHTLFIIGLSLITSSLQVRLRDIRYITDVLINAIFFLTPVFYPLKLIEEISSKFLNIYMLNPIASIVTLYRIVILGDYFKHIPSEISFLNLIVPLIILTIILLYIGFYIFKKLEPYFADFV